MDWLTVYTYLLTSPWVFWTTIAFACFVLIVSCAVGCLRVWRPHACRDLEAAL